MTMFQPIGVASDRVVSALIAGLEIEFGRAAAEGLAQHFIEAEDCDFLWDARIEERWIGAYPAPEEQNFELDRVAILGCLDDEWFAATCIVDGEGRAHGLIAKRSFSNVQAAQMAFITQH